MKLPKLLAIVASVCLMAFFNVLSFAQTAQKPVVEMLAEILEAEGYEALSDGNCVDITITNGDYFSLCPEEKPGDSGIWAQLVPQADTSAEDPAEETDNAAQLAQCLAAAELLYDVNLVLCKVNPNQFLCETEAAFERALNFAKCVIVYVPQQPPSGDVVSVFVTEERYLGNLGGLAGADATCQAAADEALLGGTWTAWLSDESTDAIDRIPDGEYRLLDETLVANDKADLTDGTLKAYINLTENGNTRDAFVWTGTASDGTGVVDSEEDDDTTPLSNCNNWTDNSSQSVGDRGITEARIGPADEVWTYAGPGTEGLCNEPNHLYCFGEGVE